MHVTRAVLALALVLLVLASGARAETYYVGPDGSDGNDGQSRAQPLASFDAAVRQLAPGDVLVLLDGTYPATDGRENLVANCNRSAQDGTAEARITVRADHERRAWIKGDGSVTPVRIWNCSYWDVSGLRVSSADAQDGAGAIVALADADHIRLRRLLLHDANRYENSTGINVNQSHHVLVEESEMYSFHRHGISSYKSDHVTFRRNFVHARGATDLDDEAAWGSHRCCTNGGDEGYTFYFTSNSTLENSVSVQSEQLSIIGGVETVLGNPGGQNNQVLGAISYHDLRPGFMQSRKFLDPARPYTGPAKNIVYRDYLIVGGQQIDRGATFAPVVAQSMTIDGATWIDTEHTPIEANPETRELADRFFLGCGREEVGGCDYDVRNALFIDDAFHESGALLYAPPHEALDVRVTHANAWGRSGRGFGVDEDIADGEGQYQQSMNVEPRAMGLGEGECIAFVPEEAPMSGAGTEGGDIGAEVLYRYEDGALTDEPLWDPETGAFPHGAVIEGSPNDPAEHEVVPANLHEHLNVGTNGCELPARYPSAE